MRYVGSVQSSPLGQTFQYWPTIWAHVKLVSYGPEANAVEKFEGQILIYFIIITITIFFWIEAWAGTTPGPRNATPHPDLREASSTPRQVPPSNQKTQNKKCFLIKENKYQNITANMEKVR